MNDHSLTREQRAVTRDAMSRIPIERAFCARLKAEEDRLAELIKRAEEIEARYQEGDSHD